MDGNLGKPVRNVYTAGWASHGAKGVLATTMYDAYEVADRFLSDHAEGHIRRWNRTFLHSR